MSLAHAQLDAHSHSGTGERPNAGERLGTSGRPDAHSRDASTRRTLYYLGPRGTFTHQAAMAVIPRLTAICGTAFEAQPADTAAQIFEHVENGDGFGIVAWENNVEGYVVPNLDALLDARAVLGIERVAVDVSFDAFVRPDHGALTEATAHPHGLAQCSGFIRRRGLAIRPADSNAAGCRDVTRNQVALGPSLCGQLYGLETLERGVQDFQGARTEFLVIAPRAEGHAYLRAVRAADGDDPDGYESILGLVPLSTGPGVLADLLDVLRDAGLNMTSFISRPIKGRDGTYSFVATIDSAPWKPVFRTILRDLTGTSTWAKTLAVYPRLTRPNPPVSAWMLPEGGVGPSDYVALEAASQCASAPAESAPDTSTSGVSVPGDKTYKTLRDEAAIKAEEELLWK